MRKFFSYDNPVWRAVLKLGQIWWLNILWVITSLPVLTIGASTTALIYSCLKLRKDDGYTTENFFRSFRLNFRQATILWFLYGGTGALLGWGLIFWNQTDRSSLKPMWALVIALLIPWFISFLYVFAVQAKFVNTIKNTIHYALILAVKNWKSTIQMTLMTAFVVYVNVATIVWANFLTLTLGIGLIAWLFAIYYEKAFEPYLPKEPDDTEQTG